MYKGSIKNAWLRELGGVKKWVNEKLVKVSFGRFGILREWKLVGVLKCMQGRGGAS